MLCIIQDKPSPVFLRLHCIWVETLWKHVGIKLINFKVNKIMKLLHAMPLQFFPFFFMHIPTLNPNTSCSLPLWLLWWKSLRSKALSDYYIVACSRSCSVSELEGEQTFLFSASILYKIRVVGWELFCFFQGSPYVRDRVTLTAGRLCKYHWEHR